MARAHWGSRLGFVLAAAGSAVGLGNVWKFPYITGENGGGAFVLVYLASIAVFSLPILMAEVLVGRTAQSSPVGAFRTLARPRSPWMSVGWLGVVTAGVIVSYYSVVAGWCLDYVWLSASGALGRTPVDEVAGLFGALHASPARNVAWHVVFMGATMGIVLGGVRGGVERASRVMMPALLVIFVVLLLYVTTLPGFGEGIRFVFGFDFSQLDGASVLEAMGHGFFSLSVGMGAMLTYGSYLSRKEDLVASTGAIALLDTVVSLLACAVLFPITFSFGMAPAAGPGLVFKNLPLAFAQLPFGSLWATVFFVLLTFAALTSAISLLEVVTAYFIDERRMSRRRATLLTGGALLVLGIPSALSGGDGLFGAQMAAATGRTWFDWFDYLSSNWALPLSGLGIALFVAWRLDPQVRDDEFASASKLGRVAWFRAGWVWLLRTVVPLGIAGVIAHALGAL